MSLFFLQNVHLLPRQQDLLLPHWHQPSLTPLAVPWEEDRTGHSRRSPRHQPASRQSGAPADPARLHAKNSPLQLQGTCKAGPALMNHTMIGVGDWNIIFFILKYTFNLQLEIEQLVSNCSSCLKWMFWIADWEAPIWFLFISKVTPCWNKQLLLSLQLFSHCMLVTLACHLGEEFTPVAHAAVDKYLSAFAAVLAEKFRWSPKCLTAENYFGTICAEMLMSLWSF